MDENRYLAAVTTGDIWICYPWEATYVLPCPPLKDQLRLTTCSAANSDIEEHDRCALENPIV